MADPQPSGKKANGEQATEGHQGTKSQIPEAKITVIGHVEWGESMFFQKGSPILRNTLGSSVLDGVTSASLKSTQS